MAREYAAAAAEAVALQLAEAVGFHSVQPTARELLGDLLLRYVGEVGAGAAAYAEQANRTDANATDVALALRDLGVGIAQLAEFAREEAFELSSPLDIAPFPVEKRMQRDPTWEEMGEAPPPHIPSWLPAFPDRHTYMHTVGFPGHDSDPHSVRMRMSEQRQQAEAALVRLGARLLPGNKLLAASLPQEEGAGEDEAAAPAAAAAAPEQPPAALDRGAAEQEKEAGAAAAEAPGAAAGPQSGNPFLAPVMWEDLPAQPLPAMEAVPAVAPAGAAGAEDAPASVANEGLAAGEAGGAWAAVEWEPSAGGTNFLPQQPQQPLFAGWDWTSQLQQRARMGAASGPQRDAYADAHASGAATRHGRRQKRTARAAEAVAEYLAADPTRSRVEDILAAADTRAEEGEAAAAMDQDLGQEHI